MNAKQVTGLDCQDVDLRQASLRCSLTVREVEVLRYIMEGRCNKEIASVLLVSPDTVKSRLRSAFAKLGVNDRTAAVIQALRLDVLHLE